MVDKKRLEKIKEVLDHVRKDTEFQEHEFLIDDLEVDWLLSQTEKYQEVQGWYWWIERRKNSLTKHNVHTFLKGISAFFKPFEEGEQK